jgi:hypothetical protein
MTGCRAGRTVTDEPAKVTITGVVGGAVVNGAECSWLLDSRGHRYDVDYPVEWSWTVGPLDVRDASGRTVIRDGDSVSLTGYLAEAGDSACHLGTLFDTLSAVRLPDPTNQGLQDIGTEV